jgi:tRNA (guanine37-N1)-methyltransferase
MRIRDLLAGTVPVDDLRQIPNHFDVIGDIAVVAIPPHLDKYKYLIAAAITTSRKNIYTVLGKSAKIAGNSRVGAYEILKGTTTITRHKEFSFQYRLDVTKTFFSPRLSYERMRVAEQVEPGEDVLVPFCGVGPYAIPAAARGAKVTAVENNSDAVQWLEENIGLNGVRKRITVIRGDALDTSLLPHRQYNRAIVPAPYGLERVLDAIAPVVIRGGMIHFYTFKTRQQIPSLLRGYEDAGFTLTFHRPCGNIAPGVSRWVFDLAK